MISHLCLGPHKLKSKDRVRILCEGRVFSDDMKALESCGAQGNQRLSGSSIQTPV